LVRGAAMAFDVLAVSARRTSVRRMLTSVRRTLSVFFFGNSEWVLS
jgi:hypothetical protein